MNQSIVILIAGVMLGSLAVVPASAQTTNSAAAAASRPVGKLEVLTQRLGLSEEQKQKAKPILEAEAQKIQALRKDSSLSADDQMARFLAIQEETKTKLKDILTPAQFEKYQQPTIVRKKSSGRATPKPPAK